MTRSRFDSKATTQYFHSYLDCLRWEEQVQLLQIEVAQNIEKHDRDRQLPQIDQSTVINIQLYLYYLKHQGIITEETLKDGERNLLIRIKLRDLNLTR